MLEGTLVGRRESVGTPMGLPSLDLAEVYAEELAGGAKKTPVVNSGRKSSGSVTSARDKDAKKEKKKKAVKKNSNLTIDISSVASSNNSASSLNPGNISPIHRQPSSSSLNPQSLVSAPPTGSKTFLILIFNNKMSSPTPMAEKKKRFRFGREKREREGYAHSSVDVSHLRARKVRKGASRKDHRH